MPSLGKDLLANALGRGFNVVVGLVCTPLYLHFLGIQSYGIVGALVSIAAIAALLTSGFDPVLKRELARTASAPDGEAEARNVVRTLEVCVWAAAGTAAAAIFFLAPILAKRWATSVVLEPNTVVALMLMTTMLTLQWPTSLYCAGLYGLDRQAEAQAVMSAAIAVRSVGAVLVLWLWSATVWAFLIWQAAATAVSVAGIGLLVWRRLPATASAAQFRLDALRRMWRFMAGSTGVEAGDLIADQVDKLLLPAFVPLEAYGLYVLAWNIGGRLQLLYGPASMAVFPRLCRADAAGDRNGLATVYRAGSQISAAVVCTTALFVALFPGDLLLLWTGNAAYASAAASLVSVFALAAGLNGLVFIPVALQLALGRTRLAFWGNVVRTAATALLLPPLAWRFGSLGGGLAFLAANALQFVILLPSTKRAYPVAGFGASLWRDVGAPFAAALCVVAMWRWGEPAGLGRLELMLYLSAALGSTAVAAGLATEIGRELAFRHRPLPDARHQG